MVKRVLAFVRSGFCAFWLFLRQAFILGFDLPLDSPEYTRQPNDSSPKALTLDLLRFGYNSKGTDSAKFRKPKFKHDQK